MAELAPNSVLPALRRDIEFRASDGTKLVGELAVPESNRPVATLLCLHPLPTHGGFMDSHVFRKASWRLPGLADIAVLRFNFRGVESPRGKSEGEFSGGAGEGLDAIAALDFLVAEGFDNIFALGWSFGTDVTIRYLNRDPIKAGILLSPPLRWTTDEDLLTWNETGRKLYAIVPELDDFLPPNLATERFKVATTSEVRVIEGAKHLWVGEAFVRKALNEVVAIVAPEKSPLPTEWNGNMTKWDDLK
ncbi:MAG: alpha/beta hydrolase [Candidatus Nanopelagicales bacterium]